MKLASILLVCSCAAAPAAVEPSVATETAVVAPTAPPAPSTAIVQPSAASATPNPTASSTSAASAKPAAIGSGSASVGAPSGSEDERPIDFEVAGDMSTAQKNVLAVVGRCFVIALDAGEEPKGALWVEVTIDDAGKSKGVKLADGFSPKMKECIPPRIAHLNFPPPGKDASIRNASRVLRFPINELSAETSED